MKRVWIVLVLLWVPAAAQSLPKAPPASSAGQPADSAILYVSKDGRYLLRGDIQDMSTDPLAAVRAQIRLDDSPSLGGEGRGVGC